MSPLLARRSHSLGMALWVERVQQSSCQHNEVNRPCEGKVLSESRDPLSAHGVLAHLALLISSKEGPVLIHHKHQQGN